MSSADQAQATSTQLQDAPIGTVRLSRDLSIALRAEIEKSKTRKDKEQPMSHIGLLLGGAESGLVHLKKCEPIATEGFAGATALERNRLHQAIENTLSKIKPNLAPGLTVVGWYAVRSSETLDLLESDVDLHNWQFRKSSNVVLILGTHANGDPVFKICSSNTGNILSLHNNRSGLFNAAEITPSSAPHVDVPLNAPLNDNFYLNVYQITKSLDRAEGQGLWGKLKRGVRRNRRSIETSEMDPDEESALPAFAGRPFAAKSYPPPLPGRSVLSSPPDAREPALGKSAAAAVAAAGAGSIQAAGMANRTMDREFAPPPPRLPAREEQSMSVPRRAPEVPMYPPPPMPPPTAAAPPSRGLGFLGIAAWCLATIVLSVLTYVAAHLYLKPVLLKVAEQAAEGTPGTGARDVGSSRSALDLRVSQNGTALELQWNPRAGAIQNAANGKLVINDGLLVREINMDPDQLRSGRIVYAPVSGDVTFSLQTIDPASQIVSDSIRVFGTFSEPALGSGLRSNGIAAPQKSPRQWSTRRGPGSGVLPSSSFPPQNRSSVTQTPAANSPNNQTGVTATEPAAPLALAYGGIPGFNPGLPSHMEPAGSPSQPARQVQVPGLSSQDLPAPPTPSPQLPQVQSIASKPAAPPAAQSQPFSPAAIVYRRYPVLPTGVLLADARVAVVVQINESGKVSSVALASSDKVPSVVTDRVLAAAREWRFSPAKFGAQPVASSMRIDFVLKPAFRR